MDAKYQAAAAALQAIGAFDEQFGVEPREFRGEITFMLASEHIVAALSLLRDEFGYDQLSDVTAVDYWPQEAPRFHVVYHLRSLMAGLIVCLRVALDGHFPVHPSVEKIFPGANWYEREIYDMFGITFSGHSDMRRIIMPADWQGHPLRKDYPLGYEEVQFSFNFDEVSKRKPHPTE